MAADLLLDRVLPFYEAIGIDVGAVLTDNGREFCGKPEDHPFELVLAVCVEYFPDSPPLR